MEVKNRALYEESADGSQPSGLGGLAIEAVRILVIGCFFWWFELGQNLLLQLVTGRWGWIYPESTGNWYDLRSIAMWWFSVLVLGVFHHFWFGPKRVPALARWLIFGVFAWGMEWLTGFSCNLIFGKPFFIWPDSPLVYVGFAGLPFWIIDTIVYEVLVRFRVVVRPMAGRKAGSRRSVLAQVKR